MATYLVSIVLFIYVFFKGYGEEGTKAKILTVIGIFFSITDLYLILNEEISYSFLLNLLLAIIPVIMLIMGAIFLSGGKPSEDGQRTKRPTKPFKSFYNINIVDNEVYSGQAPTQNIQNAVPAAQQAQYSQASTQQSVPMNNHNTPVANEHTPINYINSKTFKLY